jgi:hypothetical protein
MTLQDRIAQLLLAAVERRRRGEPDQSLDPDPGIEFIEIPAGNGAAALRLACVQCTECHLPVLRDAAPAHGLWHVRMALAAAGGTSSAAGFIAPSAPESPAPGAPTPGTA